MACLDGFVGEFYQTFKQQRSKSSKEKILKKNSQKRDIIRG